MTSYCNLVLTCPIPDGIVLIRKAGSTDGPPALVPMTGVREGIQRFTFEKVPVGFEYEIRGFGGAAIFFAFQLANIQGDCIGEDFCKSTIKPGDNRVTVNFHYASRL